MKEVVKVFKELKKTPRGRSVLFFGVSILFFIFIAIYARVVGPHSIEKIYNNVSVEETMFGELKNYTYEIVVNIDGKSTVINGKVSDEVEMFTYNNINYYIVENRVYILKEGQMTITTNPNPYYRITNTNTIKQLINSSYLDSTTTYHDESVIYNYLMDTNKLNEIINKKNTDIESKMNKLIIKVNKDKLIDNINYELLDYCKSNSICKKNMNIILKFSNIGSTDKIEIEK